jgi:hypothetical protein
MKGTDIALTHTWFGDTGSRYLCDGCDAHTEMQRYLDSRAVEPIGNGNYVDRGVPADADPPRRPTYYVCPKCNHAHEGQPKDRHPY